MFCDNESAVRRQRFTATLQRSAPAVWDRAGQTQSFAPRLQSTPRIMARYRRLSLVSNQRWLVPHHLQDIPADMGPQNPHSVVWTGLSGWCGPRAWSSSRNT